MSEAGFGLAWTATSRRTLARPPEKAAMATFCVTGQIAVKCQTRSAF